MVQTQLTVEELYRAVWHKPLKALAELWQLHPHALGQLLDKHQIPRPPNGYWTQKSVGKDVGTSALPDDISRSQLIDISFLQSSTREKSKNKASPLPLPNKALGSWAGQLQLLVVSLVTHFVSLSARTARLAPSLTMSFIKNTPRASSHALRL